MRVTVCILAALLASAARAEAQRAASPAPADVAAAFFRAAGDGRWRDAAALLDVTALEYQRREHVARARLSATRPPEAVTVEELMRLDPKMPRAAAEYQAQQHRELLARDPGTYLQHDYADVASVDTLAALPVLEMAARWLRAKDPRWQHELAWRSAVESGRCPARPPSTTQAEPPREIVGAIVQDSVAYVVHRAPRDGRRSFQGAMAELHDRDPVVLRLRRGADGWRVVPNRETLGNGVMGVSMVCQPPAPPPRDPFDPFAQSRRPDTTRSTRRPPT